MEEQSCIRRVKVRETAYGPLVTCTLMALEIDRRDLPNRVSRGHICDVHAREGGLLILGIGLIRKPRQAE